MKRSTWIQAVVAAMVIVGVGVVLANAEELRVKVEKTSDDQVTVDLNGTAETVNIADLAEGESRTITVDGHAAVVTRVGDEMTVSLDGKLICPPGLPGEHCDADGVHKTVIVKRIGGEGVDDLVWIGDNAPEHVITKKIVVGGDGEEEHVVLIGGDEGCGEEAEVFIKRIGEGDDALAQIDVLLNQKGLALPHIHGEDKVRYRCPEDGTQLVLDKDDANQESYVCAVCGRVMDKVETPEVRMVTVVLEDEEENDD